MPRERTTTKRPGKRCWLSPYGAPTSWTSAGISPPARPIRDTSPGKIQSLREDTSTLPLGRDGKYHLIFTMSETLVDELPEQLVLQALAIAQRTARTILKRKGRKSLVEK